MNFEEAKTICEKFALEHKIIFDDDGECGFGRECVGFCLGDSWIDHNPIDGKSFEPIKKFICEDARAPGGVDFYHKHNCLAVLGTKENAVKELASWVMSMQRAGKVKIVEYQKNPHNQLQGMLTGFIGCTVFIEK